MPAIRPAVPARQSALMVTASAASPATLAEPGPIALVWRGPGARVDPAGPLLTLDAGGRRRVAMASATTSAGTSRSTPTPASGSPTGWHRTKGLSTDPAPSHLRARHRRLPRGGWSASTTCWPCARSSWSSRWPASGPRLRHGARPAPLVAAGGPSAAALLYVNGFTQYASGGPREKTTLVLFLLAALIAAATQSALGGVFVSLATLTWQPVFFVGLATGLVAPPALDRGGACGARRVRGRRARAAVGVPGVLRRARPPAGLPRLLRAHPRPLHPAGGLPVRPRRRSGSEVRLAYGGSLWMLIGGGLLLLGASVWILLGRERRADPTSAC